MIYTIFHVKCDNFSYCYIFFLYVFFIPYQFQIQQVDKSHRLLKDVRANCFCASLLRTKFTRHVMHRARALSSKASSLCDKIELPYSKKKINKLFTGFGSVRIVKNCDLGQHFQDLGHSFSRYGPTQSR